MAADTRSAAIQFNGCARPGAISSALRQPRAAPGVPIAYGNPLVVADALGTTIKSTSMASLEIPACMSPAGYRRGQVL
jgi:hypothetical protein